MLRAAAAIVGLSVFLCGCNRNNQSKEQVRQAILDRLRTKSGLDLKELDVNTTSVTFDKNLAYATVSFHPKGDASLNSGMVMKYTLQNESGKWVVTNVGDGQGHALTGPHAGSDPQAAGELPPGHPQIGGTPQ